jgi:hypothetical protein
MPIERQSRDIFFDRDVPGISDVGGRRAEDPTDVEKDAIDRSKTVMSMCAQRTPLNKS